MINREVDEMLRLVVPMTDWYEEVGEMICRFSVQLENGDCRDGLIVTEQVATNHGGDAEYD